MPSTRKWTMDDLNVLDHIEKLISNGPKTNKEILHEIQGDHDRNYVHKFLSNVAHPVLNLIKSPLNESEHNPLYIYGFTKKAVDNRITELRKQLLEHNETGKHHYLSPLVYPIAVILASNPEKQWTPEDITTELMNLRDNKKIPRFEGDPTHFPQSLNKTKTRLSVNASLDKLEKNKLITRKLGDVTKVHFKIKEAPKTFHKR